MKQEHKEEPHEGHEQGREGPHGQVAEPARIARLPHDPRGYPIPWNVLRRKNGEPVFTANDDTKHWAAIRQELCPICGERLGRWRWFTGGPASAFDPNGWYIDLPAHHECAQYSLQVCPYLAMPKYLRRIDVPNMEGLPTPVLMLDEVDAERPEVFVSVAGPAIEIATRREAPLISPFVRPTRPYLAVEFWRHGKQLGESEGRGLAAEWMRHRQDRQEKKKLTSGLAGT